MEEIEVCWCEHLFMLLTCILLESKKRNKMEFTGSENGDIETLQNGEAKLLCKGDNFQPDINI